jgi:hypothetical protein
LATTIHSREGFVFINDSHLSFLKSIFLFTPRLATMIHSREGFVFINDNHLTCLKSIFLFPPRLATVAHSEESFVFVNHSQGLNWVWGLEYERSELGLGFRIL